MLVASLLLLAAILVPVSIAVYFTYSKERHKKSANHLDNLSHKDELRLINVIGGLSDGLIVIDNSYKPWIVNDAARSFLAITKQEPAFSDISSAFPQKVNLTERVKEVINFNRSTTLHELDLNDRTFKVIIQAISNKELNINAKDSLRDLGASILLQDISSEKALEKQKEDFSNVIVHELRAPVVAIKDSASLLVSDGVGEKDAKNMLNMIHNQAQKLLTQISYILDADKVEEGRLHLEKTMGDIGKVVQDEVELFLPEAKRKNISLIPAIGNNIPNFNFDNNKIVEAINNLISNSLKYTNEGGMIKITLDTDDKFKSTGSGNVIITISDNGVGIPTDKQKQLFTKFGQLSSNKETENVSSGLGLYITKGIIEAHGGQISVHSAEGKGTIVTFNIPIELASNAPDDKILSTSARPSL